MNRWTSCCGLMKSEPLLATFFPVHSWERNRKGKDKKRERQRRKQLISPKICGHEFAPSFIEEHTCALAVIVQHQFNFKVTISALGCKHPTVVWTVTNQFAVFFSCAVLGLNLIYAASAKETTE